MLLSRFVIAIAAGLLASGCVVVPVNRESYDDDCKVIAHHMELTTVQLKHVYGCDPQVYEVEQLCVLGAVGLAAASTVVSGSIAVVGNIAYWTERRAACIAPSLGLARST